MSDTLTPPDAAPLPWSVFDDPSYGPTVVDGNHSIVAGVSLEGDDNDNTASRVVAQYLIDAANTAPKLAQLRTLFERAAKLAGDWITAASVTADADDFPEDIQEAVETLAALRKEVADV